MKTGGTRKPKPEKQIKSWTIYLWQNEDKYEGAAPIVTKDGVKAVYCFGWKIEKEPDVKRNENKHQIWRAKIKVKNLLNNTLNVLNWYGKQVLDRTGNIDQDKYLSLEAQAAFRCSQVGANIEDAYPIRKFPTKEITPQQAKEYKFI